MRDGTISIAGAEAIRSGRDAPTTEVTAEALAQAAHELVARIAGPRTGGSTGEAGADTEGAEPGRAEAALAAGARTTETLGRVDADTLYRWAREAREAIDADGIRDRERADRAARSFRRWRRPDGMTRYTWELDAEGVALVDEVYDQLTSPRRGGPRFTHADDRARAEAILRDTRTTDQLASDGILELLRIGAATAPTALIGTRRPAVRVLVTETALRARAAGGHLEGHPSRVSIETVERHLCESGTLPILFDTNQRPIDVGREQRLFTSRQRTALAARDGGCRAPGCDKPPSWTEAHHIEHWQRDGGAHRSRQRHPPLPAPPSAFPRPALGNRRGGEYWLTPPAHLDPTRTPRPMPGKSAALRELDRTRARGMHSTDSERTPVTA